MYGLTNLLIKVSEEVPMFDGSARDICSKIDEAGILGQKRGVDRFIVREPIVLTNLPKGKSLSVESPPKKLEIDYTLDYPPPIGRQRYFFTGGKESFLANIASARTFGTIDDFREACEDRSWVGGKDKQRHAERHPCGQPEDHQY